MTECQGAVCRPEQICIGASAPCPDWARTTPTRIRSSISSAPPFPFPPTFICSAPIHRLSAHLIPLLVTPAATPPLVRPPAFERILPPYLPAPYALVYVSGAAELLGALGVLVPGLRRYAGWGLLLLALAVFPANVHMALHPADFEGIPAWALYLRLPLQVALVGWIYWALGLRIRT